MGLDCKMRTIAYSLCVSAELEAGVCRCNRFTVFSEGHYHQEQTRAPGLISVTSSGGRLWLIRSCSGSVGLQSVSRECL